MKENKKFLKECLFILFVGLLINIACFLMPLTVKAAGENTTNLPLPIGVPNGLNIPSDKVDYVKNAYINYLTSNYGHDVSQTYTIFVDTIVNQGTPNETIYITATSGFYVDLTNWNSSISYLNGQQHYCQFTYYPASDTILGPTFYGGWLNTWTYSPSDLANYKGWVLDNYAGDIISGDTLVWTVSFSPNPDEFTPSPLVPTPSDNPKPTAPIITPPTIDTSLTLIENIQNLFHWLGETIKSVIKWAIDSIGTFFDNLKNFLKDIINAVITAINNGFNNVFLNFKNLISPFFAFFTAYAQGIQDFFDALTDSQTGIIPFLKTQIANIRQNVASMFDNLVTIQTWLVNMGNAMLHPYDQAQIELFIQRSTFVSSFRTLSTNLTNFVTNFFDIAEPQTLTFTLDFRNAYYNFGQCEISFDWLNPFKVPLRACLVGVLCLSVLNNLIEDLPSMFSGGGSHSKGTSK